MTTKSIPKKYEGLRKRYQKIIKKMEFDGTIDTIISELQKLKEEIPSDIKEEAKIEKQYTYYDEGDEPYWALVYRRDETDKELWQRIEQMKQYEKRNKVKRIEQECKEYQRLKKKFEKV